ncbi:MAG: ankyrin repeat domain-containing protein [Leptospiraceae bacterium]|nr:ankyrin repeat domain-containing protein [Leptospiraceae bacterium]
MKRPVEEYLLRGDISGLPEIRKSDPNSRVSADNRTFLHLAVIGKNIEIVQVLLDQGADQSARDKQGLSPLHLAVISKLTAVAKVILDAGAEVDPRDRRGLTPLWYSISIQPLDYDLIYLLLERGANADLVFAHGRSPRSLAAEMNDPNLMSVFRRAEQVKKTRGE